MRPSSECREGEHINEVCVLYTAENGKSGEYRVWKEWRGKGIDSYLVYCWTVGGVSGEAESGFYATQAAKQYIKEM